MRRFPDSQVTPNSSLNGSVIGGSRPVTPPAPKSQMTPAVLPPTGGGLTPQPLPGTAYPPAVSSRPPLKPFVPKTVSLFDAMRWNGPAPEVINGRLAMVGFVLGAMNESKTATPLEVQMAGAGYGTYLLVALIIWGSMAPILKAAKNEAFGWFSPRAEATNGRAAMLGFGTLLLMEHSSGVCFF